MSSSHLCMKQWSVRTKGGKEREREEEEEGKEEEEEEEEKEDMR